MNEATAWAIGVTAVAVCMTIASTPLEVAFALAISAPLSAAAITVAVLFFKNKRT